MHTEHTRSPPRWTETESLILRTRRHDLLIEGPGRHKQRCAGPHAVALGRTIVWKRPQAPLELPASEPQALILEDIAALSA